MAKFQNFNEKSFLNQKKISAKFFSLFFFSNADAIKFAKKFFGNFFSDKNEMFLAFILCRNSSISIFFSSK